MKIIKIAATLIGLSLSFAVFGAQFQLINADPPGVGFNDPTPATPIGGNTGTTVGEQRLIAYQRALDLWGATLESNVTIYVGGSFAGLPCNAGGGVLARAGTTAVFADFSGAPLAGRWYHSALADAISGQDLILEEFGVPEFPDLVAEFNGDIGQPDCIAGPGWYYGLDNNAGTGETDFLNVFMHEISHGLGFANFANEETGEAFLGVPDVYMANTLDLTFQEFWDTDFFEPFDLTEAFIRFSAVNTGQVVWGGPNVNGNAAAVLGDFEGIRLTGTISPAQDVDFGTAAFGPPATVDNFGGEMVLVDDAVGVGSDGCEPIVNDVAGKVALIDRGLCAFVVKVKNAQDAGASSAVIANNAPGGGTINMAGNDPTITIASVFISFEDGATVKANSPGAVIEVYTDPTRLAGTNQGLVRLYAPGTVALGSSISHFDTVASPNLLMEPFINSDLKGTTNVDLTPALMQDVGWNIDTLKIGDCETGVANYLVNGDLIGGQVLACADGARNKGQFVSCLNEYTNAAKKAGLITGKQKGAITSCAGQF